MSYIVQRGSKKGMKKKLAVVSATFALVATVALAPVLSSAASRFVITKSTQVKPGAIGYNNLSATAKAKLHGAKGATGATGPTGPAGTAGTPGGATGAAGPAGAPGAPGTPGTNGVNGTNGTNGTNATTESWSDCGPSLCLDAPPEGPNGVDGSSGWGWDNASNAPVSSVAVGSSNSFTVTVMQPSPAGTTGTITLAWSSADFTLNGTSGGGVVGTNPFDRGGVETFTYGSGFFSHTDQSDSFTFTAVGKDPSALVTATVDVNGQQASETFPVAIVAAS